MRLPSEEYASEGNSFYYQIIIKKSIPKGCHTGDMVGTQASKIKKSIPKGCHTGDMVGNQASKIKKSIPKGCQAGDMVGTQASKIKKSIPKGCHTGDMVGTQASKIKKSIPKGCQAGDIVGTQASKIKKSIPKGCQAGDMVGNQVSKIKKLVQKSIKRRNYMVKKGMSSTELLKAIENRCDELKAILQKTEHDIMKAPSGRIHVVNSRNRIQYYLRTDSSRTDSSRTDSSRIDSSQVDSHQLHSEQIDFRQSEVYMSKSDMKKIRIFLQKRYDERIVKLLEREIKCSEKYYSELNDIETAIKKLYSKYPDEVKEYVIPTDCSDDDYRRKWEAQTYEGKQVMENVPIYISDKGDRVRSKSELNIANALFKHKIPYKYECPLELQNGKTIYPDFTVLNVRKRKVIFWEHRGMMDDREYARYAVMRVKDYQKNGIILGDNLVITEETLQSQLSTLEIHQTIKDYFE